MIIEVTADSTLPDRNSQIEISSLHYVNNKNVKENYPNGCKEIFLGLGCFWGAERLFWNSSSVYVTSVGYGGGYTKNPTYQDICSGKTGHAELVKVIFKDEGNNFENIIKVFFENHDPTQGMRQGNDIGTQYRSCIYTNNEDHYLKSSVLLKKFQSILQNNNLDQIITTEIKKNIDFFYAEDYHQQYLAKNPQGYCGIQGLGLDLDII
jgi:peptide-methionine (S)-S-oxide reductase